MNASRRQRLIDLLSLYVDFIFVNAVVALANFLVGKAFGYLAGEGMPYVIEIGVSGLLVALARVLGLSVGRPLLAYARAEASLPVRRRLWPNLLLGTLLILDGLKQAIRWTQLEATLPVFGLLEMTPLKVAASLSLGCLSAGAGLLLIAFAPAAKRFAAASIAGSTASLLLGWSALPEGIRQVTLARRAYQSRPVRDGEIEFLQIVTPYGAVALLVLLAALLYLCRARDA